MSGSLLLAQLPHEDQQRVLALSTSVSLSPGRAVRLPEAGVGAFFIESGFASVMLSVAGIEMEVGLVGREGMLGLPTLLGSDVSPYCAVIRHSTTARHIASRDLLSLADRSPAISSMMIRAVQAGSVQVIFNSFANAHSTVASRVARWIAMACDRVEADTITTTHNVIATGIGVQRSGVTLALRDFQAMNVLVTTRGTIKVLDPDRLRSLAGPAYGQAEAAFRLLFPESKRALFDICAGSAYEHQPATT